MMERSLLSLPVFITVMRKTIKGMKIGGRDKTSQKILSSVKKSKRVCL